MLNNNIKRTLRQAIRAYLIAIHSRTSPPKSCRIWSATTSSSIWSQCENELSTTDRKKRESILRNYIRLDRCRLVLIQRRKNSLRDGSALNRKISSEQRSSINRSGTRQSRWLRKLKKTWCKLKNRFSTMTYLNTSIQNKVDFLAVETQAQANYTIHSTHARKIALKENHSLNKKIINRLFPTGF